MNAQTHEMAQVPSAESLCGYCRRPWFGQVAYCPYCGRKPSVSALDQEPGEPPRSNEALAGGQVTLAMPGGELQSQEANSPGKQARTTPPQAAPASALLVEMVIAAVGAVLLFWMVVKLPAQRATEAVPATVQVPASTRASSGPVASTNAASLLPSAPARSGSPVAPGPNRTLCSAANEAAGLCKSQ